MKQAKIYYKDILAGVLTESDDGYEFRYLQAYLASENAKPVSLTLPLQNQPYRSNVLFPFFDGLIPEGWLLDVCSDCIGAVSVKPVNMEENDDV